AEWPLIFESMGEPGILYGTRGKYPNEETQRLGPMSDFKINGAQIAPPRNVEANMTQVLDEAQTGKTAWGDKGMPVKSPADEKLVDMGVGEHKPLAPGDYGKYMAHLKQAVDDKAKEYYDSYYGSY